MSTKTGKQASQSRSRKTKQKQQPASHAPARAQDRPQAQSPQKPSGNSMMRVTTSAGTPTGSAPAPAPVDRREARLQRQAAARAAADRRRRMKTLRQMGIFAAVIVVLLGVGLAIYIREASKPGQGVPIMSDRHHLGPGETSPIPYSTDPPTSGPHVGDLPQFKVYTEPITKELQVHALEDGGVVINYRPDLDKTTVDKLAGIATSYIERGGGAGHVVMSPYPGLPNPIVLTAWGRIDRLDQFDEARIRRFIDAYVGIDHHEGSEGQRIP